MLGGSCSPCCGPFACYRPAPLYIVAAYTINGTDDGSWPATPSSLNDYGGMIPKFDGYGCNLSAVCYKNTSDRNYQTVSDNGYSASYSTLQGSNESTWRDESLKINAQISADNRGSDGGTFIISTSLYFGVVALAIEQNCRYYKPGNPATQENTFTTTVRILAPQRDATVSANVLGQSLTLSPGEFTKSYTTNDRTGNALPITFTASRVPVVYRSQTGALSQIVQNISINLLGFLDDSLASVYAAPAGDYQNNLPPL